MKKIFLVIALASISTWSLTSCGSKQEEKKEEGDAYNEYETAEPSNEAKESTDESASGNPDELIAQGQTLIDKSDCKTCHHNTNKLIGPAYTDVAKKYDFTKAVVADLAGKVISGGSGVWGEIPMTAHPDLSKADAEKMAMYVLSLDGEKPNL